MNPEPWPQARQLELPRGTYELLGDGKPCAFVDGQPWYWCVLRKVNSWRNYSGVIAASPADAPMDELVPELREMVKRAKW